MSMKRVNPFKENSKTQETGCNRIHFPNFDDMLKGENDENSPPEQNQQQQRTVFVFKVAFGLNPKQSV